MFNRNKICALELRINELESRIFDIENNPQRIGLVKSPTFGDDTSILIMGKGEIEETKLSFMSIINTSRYTVSIPYLLDLILNHLGVEIDISDKKDSEVTISKKKPVKKPKK